MGIGSIVAKIGAVGALWALTAAAPAHAASSWGIEYEEIARVEAKVVDLLCEITGNCADQCGGGKRQLGLLLDDGRLIPVVKNQDIFAGATNDLIGFCGKRIVADGLIINDPQMTIFALQFKRLAPDGEWSRANQFSKDWSAANGGADAGNWYAQDPRVREIIESTGKLGVPDLKPAQ